MEIKSQPTLAVFSPVDIQQLLRLELKNKGYYVLEFQPLMPTITVKVATDRTPSKD